ncbi:testis-expressed protein 22 isoform X1 [Nomascus leucogenys]|uniref:testis-expressed protein 22 isoform X1 n=2 Tax=Nomascus leucogenys TaxID=61853 RepID=UPI00122D8173|nr:testis-expressed protein 22 isoform X1 [Nomascus leucogenys]
MALEPLEKAGRGVESVQEAAEGLPGSRGGVGRGRENSSGGWCGEELRRELGGSTPPRGVSGWKISEVWTSSLLGLEMDSRKLSPQGKKLESHLSQEHRRSPLGLTAAWGQPSIQSSAQQGLQTQDWVCEPPERRRPGRHWSVSIDERRRLAMLGGRERPGAAGAPLHCRDIVQMVAQLVSEDVDKDVLFPHPLRSTESTNAFQAFLARSAPFWHNATFEARASRSPPS